MFNNVLKNCLWHVPKHRKSRLDKTIMTVDPFTACATSVQKLQNVTSAKHFSKFTQLFLVYICTCVIILKVTRNYLNLERKATLRLHRLCLSIHVFHADWCTKKRGLFHINKVNKSKYSHNWNIDGQLYRRGFASADWSRYIDETSFFLKFLSIVTHLSGARVF